MNLWKKKKVGRPVGIPKFSLSGRKKGSGQGRKRDKNISFRVSEEEKEYIYNILDRAGTDRTGAIISIFKEFEKNL